MQTDPKLQLGAVIACLKQRYDLEPVSIIFQPLGFDTNTVIYKVIAQNSQEYFLKIRTGNFIEASALLPEFLASQGIKHIIAPIADKHSKVWNQCGDLYLVLFPFVSGSDANKTGLSDTNKQEFGKLLKSIHSLEIPKSLRDFIPIESYPATWSNKLQEQIPMITEHANEDPLIKDLSEFVNDTLPIIKSLLKKNNELAINLRSKTSDFVLCHADCHAWNILLTKEADFFLIDWDMQIIAPKERDLMFIGSKIDNLWNTTHDEELFYQGYGDDPIDKNILAYFRQSRIIEDLAIMCQEICQTDRNMADRELMLKYFKENFFPRRTIEIALQLI